MYLSIKPLSLVMFDIDYVMTLTKWNIVYRSKYISLKMKRFKFNCISQKVIPMRIGFQIQDWL